MITFHTAPHQSDTLFDQLVWIHVLCALLAFSPSQWEINTHTKVSSLALIKAYCSKNLQLQWRQSSALWWLRRERRRIITPWVYLNISASTRSYQRSAHLMCSNWTTALSHSVAAFFEQSQCESCRRWREALLKQRFRGWIVKTTLRSGFALCNKRVEMWPHGRRFFSYTQLSLLYSTRITRKSFSSVLSWVPKLFAVVFHLALGEKKGFGSSLPDKLLPHIKTIIDIWRNVSLVQWWKIGLSGEFWQCWKCEAEGLGTAPWKISGTSLSGSRL